MATAWWSFSAPGKANIAAVGQGQYCLTRTSDAKPLGCPNLRVEVTLTGAGPGSDSDMVTVTECVEGDMDALEVSDVSNGGTVLPKEGGDEGTTITWDVTRAR